MISRNGKRSNSHSGLSSCILPLLASSLALEVREVDKAILRVDTQSSCISDQVKVHMVQNISRYHNKYRR